jgi:hypothetical protein
LAIEHPTTGKNLQFRSELPPDLASLHHDLAVYGADSRYF